MIWLKRITIVLSVAILLLMVGFVALGFVPVEEDPTMDPRAGGAGAASVEESWTGLQREFPSMNWPEETPNTPKAIQLGRLLFFDPILSGNDDMSCASCHHPDLGFADGQAHPVGAGGAVLPRHTPSLWNVGWAEPLFWDGRAESLEDQADMPLTHPEEMAATPANIEADLQANPEYVEQFRQVFPNSPEPVTFEHVRRLLAAFQRTFISNDSPFDRFAAGDVNALTPAQRRGLNLFRSAATRCYECHTPPLFTTNTFRVIGVPEAPGVDDPGRAGVAPDAPEGAFRTPSLRNIALTAPYMHNGAFATLEEVIDFYAQGGGHAYGKENVDRFVLGFDLSDQEKADMVAFLKALTDEKALTGESEMLSIPAEVPSGLPVEPRRENPARDLLAQTNTVSSVAAQADRSPKVWRVQSGQNIQETVDQALPGDAIEIEYGVYHQNVVVNANDISIRGIPNEADEWPILDGQNQFADGIMSSGNNFTVEKLHIRNYKSNGVLVEGVQNVVVRDLFVEDTGIYGVYPVHCTGVLIERVEATGIKDAGIYVGQSEDIIVRASVAYSNVIGIEVENSVNSEVYDNHTYSNSVGVFFDLLPNLTSKVFWGGKIYNNRIENNNHPNFADADMTASLIPQGTGILILAADGVEIYDNIIRNSQSVGIAIYRLTIAFDPNTIDVPDRPEQIWIHDNVLEANGYNPDPSLAALGIPGADIIWDGSAWSVAVDQSGVNTFPPLIPSSKWPEWVRKAYWHILDFAIQRLL